MDETDLLHLFMVATPATLPHVCIFRRNILNVRTDTGRRVRNGIKGQADAYALVDGGRHVELEAKSATGVMSPKQLAWQRNCRRRGIPHLVIRARQTETPDATVARWVAELREEIARHPA